MYDRKVTDNRLLIGIRFFPSRYLCFEKFAFKNSKLFPSSSRLPSRRKSIKLQFFLKSFSLIMNECEEKRKKKFIRDLNLIRGHAPMTSKRFYCLHFVITLHFIVSMSSKERKETEKSLLVVDIADNNGIIMYLYSSLLVFHAPQPESRRSSKTTNSGEGISMLTDEAFNILSIFLFNYIA